MPQQDAITTRKFDLILMDHQQQNKWYPQMCLFDHFGATLYLLVAYLLTHNNLWICYYGQVNSLRLK